MRNDPPHLAQKEALRYLYGIHGTGSQTSTLASAATSLHNLKETTSPIDKMGINLPCILHREVYGVTSKNTYKSRYVCIITLS